MAAGGKREGAGRNCLYGKEIVKRISISIPARKESEIRVKIKKILKRYMPKKKK